jgi:addiction module RelB/DinJ family antitoxin
MSIQVSIPIDEVVKQQFVSVCEVIGITPSHALSMFITNTVRDNAISLNTVSSPKKRPKKRRKRTREEVFGCARGRFNIPDDFNDPLEDFKEYME